MRVETEVDIQTAEYNNCARLIYCREVSDGTEVGTENDEYMWNENAEHMGRRKNIW